MAGRREQQKRARERAIRRAARRLFERRGFDATSMEEIAARAGLAVGTVYNYFPSKPELLLAILRADASEVGEVVEGIAKELPDDPGAAVSALCDAYLELALRHDRRLWREVLAAALASPESVGRSLFEVDMVLVGQLARLLEELQQRGVLGGHFEPGRAALVLYGTYLTWFMVWVASDALDVAALRRQMRDGIDVVLHGLLGD
jgi:AcrR family transcriptional regulator